MPAAFCSSAQDFICSDSLNDDICTGVSFTETALAPRSLNVSNLIFDPRMKDCSGEGSCPAPANADTISADCALFKQYSALCIDMPGMDQCAEYNQFCSETSPIANTSFCSSMGGGMGHDHGDMGHDHGDMANGTKTEASGAGALFSSWALVAVSLVLTLA
ncbi:MAG: hypothetical protein SGCHY_004316 [Lobulomycetales sp.]